MSVAIKLKPLNAIVVPPFTATSLTLVKPSNNAAVLIAVEPPVEKLIAVNVVPKLSASADPAPSRMVKPLTPTELPAVNVEAV